MTAVPVTAAEAFEQAPAPSCVKKRHLDSILHTGVMCARPRSNIVTKRMETKLVTYQTVDMREKKKLNQWQNDTRKKQSRRGKQRERTVRHNVSTTRRNGK